MQLTDDGALLRRYVENGSDEAFADVVSQHINLVYSVALRQVGNPHQAEEITQAVFIILAKKAAQLRHDKALSSWLFQATRLTANNLIRSEMRRQRREQEAFMQSTLNETGDDAWPNIAPLLDTAVASLSEKDRRAVVLRFYEGRSIRDVGVALGASEGAAEKRVLRAVEKLRSIFTRKGIVLSSAVLTSAISANSVQAAPAVLAKSVAAVAIAKGAVASASTLTLIKGTLKIMAWAKAKTAVVAAAALILAAGTTTVIVKSSGHHPQVKLQWTPAEKESFQQESIARMSEGRQWALAAIKFAADHGNILPTNFRQIKTYVSNLSASNWEVVSGGSLSGIAKPAQTILFKEKEARPSPDGKFAKGYVFVDGHVEMVHSPDYEFATVEQKNGFLIEPAKN
ncbi:MAG: RNA polymerase sigma factor [Limisphaerales bacterium]